MLVAWLLNFVFFVQPNPMETKTQITDVTLYRNGAMITAETAIQIQKGQNTIVLSHLSPNIDESSIQISGLKNASVNGVIYRITSLERKEESVEFKNINARLKAEKKAQNDIISQISGLEEELLVLQQNKKLEGEQKFLTAEQLSTFAKFHRERLAKIKSEIYDLRILNDEKQQLINALNQEKNTISSMLSENRGMITLKIQSDEPLQTKLQISYVVYNAQWSPIYEIRSQSGKNSLNLKYRAQVYQNTGEDWKNVKLTLSTAVVSGNQIKPEVLPQYVDIYVPAPPSPVAGYIAPENEMLSEVVISSYSLDKRTKIKAADVEDVRQRQMISTLFKLPSTHTLMSSPEQNMVQIDQFDIPATLEYYAAPLLSESVFLTASLKNWEAFDLTSGEALLYIDGQYGGKTIINPEITEEELVIAMGIDKGISIERKALKEFSDASFLGQNKIQQKKYQTTIRNNKENAVQIKIVDRIPVSQNKDIKIEKVQLDGAELKNETGILEWKLNIPAKQTQTRTLSYDVRYPRNKILSW